jgi:hypothetical protein
MIRKILVGLFEYENVKKPNLVVLGQKFALVEKRTQQLKEDAQVAHQQARNLNVDLLKMNMAKN